MNVPIVKEWGSWAVFISSLSAGLITGLSAYQWQAGRVFSIKTLFTVLGLSLLINSKNPLASTIRTKGANKEHLLWFLFFSLAGLAFLAPFLVDGLKPFSIFFLFIASYVILLSHGKEHYLVTELNGFALLTLSAPIVYFMITGEMSLRLYAAVFIFFAAGVLKVRVRLKKTLVFRWITAFYCSAAPVVFYALNIPVILLLPLLENIFHVLLMRKEKLKTTGDIELIKAVIFIVLIGLFRE